MKILVQGRPIVKKYRKFECQTCGCVFLADEKEYTGTFPLSIDGVIMWKYRCNCPNCKTLVSVLNIDSEEVTEEEANV